MTEENSKGRLSYNATSKQQAALFWTCMLVIALVPLVFSTSVYRIYVLPKFSVLLVGSALILFLLGLTGVRSTGWMSVLRSQHVVLALLFVGAAAISTLLGAVPLASLFGSFQSEMGLLTRLCFLICFIGLIAAVGCNMRRFTIAAWVIAATGLLAAVYAFLQFFGWDPFLSLSAYTVRAPGGTVVRVIGPLGHSNYLGNFLLYTAPMTASLALAWHGRPRRIAMVAVMFSVAAVAFSGTRGAWFGLFAGAATIGLLELRALRAKGVMESKRMMIRAAFACAGVLILALVIVSSPASRDVASRARSFVEDRFTGSGRILLWRDALKMVPRFALIGSGPEAFSREFLAFKSLDLARSAPQINNENPHNSFLDAAISVGLPGAILYAAFVCSAFSLLLKARRSGADRKIALICSGLLASLVAVTVHNLFIYDQIPTGLYFFVFNALALIAWNVTQAQKQAAAEELASEPPVTGLRWTGLAIASSGAALLIAAAWFSASIIGADVALKRAMLSARAGDFEGLVAHGERASRSLDPTGAYNFQFARALAIYGDSIPKNAELASPQNHRSEKADIKRKQAIEAAVDQAQKSLPHTLTPDASYVLLAYLAFAQGDNSKLHDYAGKAIDWDPNYFNARWLMAEALLAEGDRDGAAVQAQLALRLRPASSEARSVLARARGESPLISPRIQGLVERARSLMERRNFDKAEDLLQRAIRDAQGPCPECHRQLALTYEEAARYKDAIAEWEMVALVSPDQEEVRQARARIEALKNK